MLKVIKLFVNALLFLQGILSGASFGTNNILSPPIYVTKSKVEIFVQKGKKEESLYDFKVSFREAGKRLRTPTHVHLIVEMYVKHAHNPELTLELRDHILNVFSKIQPIEYSPPKLQIFKLEHVDKFTELDKVGEFSVEFLLVVSELIMIQEKTNYPKGSLTQRLYSDFGKKDRFSVIQSAVFRG